MGVIHEAEDASGRRVALKVMRETANAAELKRFERESRQRIEHPNVVRVLDSGEDRGHPYIAFELLEGQSLNDRINDRLLEAAEGVEVGRQICAGLAAAHAQHVIHRDLKPGNIFICRDGTVKLLDFGVAFWSEQRTRLTAGDWKVLGTPSYLSPEQARGEEVDERTDVWGAGIVLYRALSGERPFTRESPLATMLAVVLDDAAPLAEANPAVPPALACVVDRCLQKTPEGRWPTVRDLGRALQTADIDDVRTQMSITLRPHQDRAEMPTAGPTASTQTLAAGERRVVALLLCEEVVDLDAIARTVLEHGGVMIPLLGHRAIALFGATTWEGDELRRAATVALAVESRAARVAVSAGHVSANGRGISGSAILKAEMACAVAATGVVLDVQVARSLGSGFSYREVADGFYRLEGDPSTTHTTSRWSTTPGPIFGREVELAQIRRALSVLQVGNRASAMICTGPPGIGKSKLRGEMERLVRAEAPKIGANVLTVAATPLGRQSALSMVAALLRNQLEIAEVSSSPAARAPVSAQQAIYRLLARATDDDEKRREAAPFIAALLGMTGVETQTFRAAAADRALMADRIRMALDDYLDGMARQGPLVVLAEDLQWADSQSMEVFIDLLERQADAPVLFFATARDEFVERYADVFARSWLTHVPVHGLAASAAEELVRSCAGGSVTDEFVSAIVGRTDGNPLFVEQIVCAVQEEDSKPKKSARPPTDVLPLPLTVEAAVQSRLDHLPSAEKEILKRVAVYQRPFSSDEVCAFGSRTPDSAMQSLVRKEFLVSRRRRFDSQREYRFSSSIVSRVAFGMLEPELRRDLHCAVANYLAGRIDTDSEEIAWHFEAGDDLDNAGLHYCDAALAASQHGDADTALRCSEKALALGQDLPHALRMARADAFRFRGDRDQQAMELALALEAARSDAERAHALTEQAVWLARTGRTEEALGAARESVIAARRANDPKALALARGWESAALGYAGQLVEAAEAVEEATQLAQHCGLHVEALAAEWSAQLAAALGDLGARREAYIDAVRLFTAAGDVRRAAGAESNLADVHNRFGSYRSAEGALRAAIDGCRRVGNRLMEGYAWTNLGYSLTMLDSIDAANAAFDEAELIAAVAQEARLGAATGVYRARASLKAARSLNADEPSFCAVGAQAEQAAAIAHETGLPGVCALALTVAASAYLDAGKLAEAEKLARRAMALRDHLGSIEEDEAEIFVVLAAILEARGADEEAALVRSLGRQRLEEMANRIRSDRWRKHFLERVASHRQLVAGSRS